MRKSDTCNEIITFQRKGEHLAAKAMYESSKSLLSDFEESEILGNAAFYSRDFQKAVSFYEEAIAKSPEYMIAPYQYLVGFSHAQKDELVEAFKRYQDAIEIDPSFVEPYVELGALLMKVQDFKGAVKCYTDAISVDPTDIGNYHNLVAAYQQLDKEEPNIHSVNLELVTQEYEKAKRELPEAEEALLWQV